MANTELAEELLQLEEADAWFEYLESTRGQTETRYAELEPWAWARLSQRLRAVRARRARAPPGRGLSAARREPAPAASLCSGHVRPTVLNPRSARPGEPVALRDPRAAERGEFNTWHYDGFASARSRTEQAARAAAAAGG